MKPRTMRKIFGICILTISIVMLFSIQSIALSIDTHRAINVYIVDPSKGFSGYSLDKYLKNNLGMSDGVTAKFNSKIVQEWIGDGGVNEDDGVRWRNHFLNPINDEGLWDSFKSALKWATLPVGGQDFSWDDVRASYRDALIAKDKTTRESSFAKTFRGVGQIMHLVQDMSVPAHTRNDSHPISDGYESWAKKNINDAKKINYSAYNNYSPFNTSLFLIPQLFDTPQYNGTNPSITLSNNIGLAEFTNANFLSADTIFKNFDYPSYKPGISMAESPTTISGKRVLYLKKIGEGATINHFARAGRFLEKLPAEHKELNLTIKDDNIHQDYADLLIPRAIGYSSQVLKYFFRGQLDVSLGDGNIKIKNASDETISNGEFKLYYDNAGGGRTLLTSAAAMTLAPNGQGEQTITFNKPEGATSYMLVYQGQLGAETNAVIGKFVPVDNNLPMIYIAVGSQCIVWDVENEKIYDKVATDSSTPENPRYAVFPCDPTTISMWKEQQITTTMHNAPMWNCGRMEPPANGAEEQLCPFALDALGAMDTYSKIYDLSDAYPQYSSEDILIYSKNSKYDDGFLRSSNSDVIELNSAVWYRVKWERHGTGDSIVTRDYWWGTGLKQSSDVQEKYSFYSVGEPFGIPFFEIYNHQIFEREYYGKGQDDMPYVKGSWNATKLAPHRNSVIYKLAWSDKLVLHVAYVTAVMSKEENNYDIIYDDITVSGPGTSVLQPRVQGLKVNLDYKKDRLIKDGKYDLGHIPVASANLKTAIQDLIDKRYMDLGLPVTDIPYNMFMDVIFYEVKSI
jgi:hypothetical protein